MARTTEDKVAKYLIDGCADSRLNEVALAHTMGRQSYDVQARFWNTLVSYIYFHAHNYEHGLFDEGTYEIARLSKKIKDLAFADERKYSSDPVHERYGDFELQDGQLRQGF